VLSFSIKRDKQKIIDAGILGEFQDHLVTLIEEILDPDVPFIEKDSTFNS
jgi:hypothetical protein